MTPPKPPKQTGEFLPEGEISNRHLALMIAKSNRTADETLTIVKEEREHRSALADRVTGLEFRVRDIEHREHVRDGEQAPALPAPLGWLRARPFFLVAALVVMTLGGSLAIVAGFLVLVRS